MEDRLTKGEESSQTSPTPYGDIFDKLLPSYIAMGMTYDEYWDGEVGTKTAYRKAYEMRMEHDQRVADRNNWLMGRYVMGALQAVPLLVAGLNVKSGTRIPDYPDKPFYDTYDQKQKEEAKAKHEEDQTKLAMAVFQSSIERFNHNLLKRQEAEKAREFGQ